MTAPRHVAQQALADLADIPARSRWARHASLRLHCLDYDSPAGTPVVILPGITTPAACLDFVARRLTDRFRPVVLDLRGRGLSDSADSFTLDDYAEDLLAILADLDLREALVLGHSLGARIAARAAVTASGRGMPLRGTVLVDPPTSGPGRAPYPTTLAMFVAQYEAACRGTTATEVARDWPRWPAREQAMRARWLSSCQREAIEATHRGFEQEDFLPLWGELPAPAVLLYGEVSPVVPASAVAELQAARPDLPVVQIPGAGHMVYWDAGDAALDRTVHALELLAEGRSRT